MNNIIEAGIDYLAMTLRRDCANYVLWYASAADAINFIRDNGNVAKQGTTRGYDGFHCGGSFYGENAEGGHLYVSGSWASRLFGSTYHPSAHYSRLDLQVTVQFPQEQRNYAEQVYTTAIAVNDARPKSQRRKIQQIVDSDGGATVYIGSRTSEHFGRIYNKAAQSDDPFYERSWRYETQFHNDYATDAATYIYNGSRSQPRISSSTVWRYFSERGVQPPYDRENEETAMLPRAAPQSDVSRKLAWLTEQVRPTIALLRELVPSAILEQALGIGLGAEALPIENRPVGED